MSNKIKRILISNRGEIALRVIATCRELGIETVTLFTPSEKGLPHTYSSNQAIDLGMGALAETYLNQEKIIQIAKETNCDAIHPGYGFLSENAGFAKKVREANLIFIGPSAEAITLMGDKKESKKRMESIGAPLIPGYHGENQEADFLSNEAKKIGFPVLIKASAGGGGKGMRIVHEEGEFAAALEAAKREAKNAFGNDIVLIEKYILGPRHIEIQVMSDAHGNHLHFFERECSIQRRHQKVIEESPSPTINEETRLKMAQSAVDIARSIDYLGAGTVEYIVDEKGDFYFLEMNTRLQVEHPITEMVTGVDLVHLQILVAGGEKLDIKQEDITQKGHAIEVRLYAEDPDQNFMPSIGQIAKVGAPTLRDTRLDTGYVDGNQVTVDFDPMLAKLITWGVDRKTATNKMSSSLNEVVFLGLKTNREYLKRILKLEEFVQAKIDTHFVETYKTKLSREEVTDLELAKALCLKLIASSKTDNSNAEAKQELSWDWLVGFRNTL